MSNKVIEYSKILTGRSIKNIGKLEELVKNSRNITEYRRNGVSYACFELKNGEKVEIPSSEIVSFITLCNEDARIVAVSLNHEAEVAAREISGVSRNVEAVYERYKGRASK
jgi:hypothetical protein